MKQTGSLTTVLCLVLLLASSLPAAAAGGRAVREIASLDLEDAALQLPLAGTLRLEGLQLETKGTPATAELERFRVFAPDAQIVLHGADGDTYLPVPRNAYFRGQIVGDPGSRVVFSVLETGGARGLITRGGRTWIMGNAKGAKAASYALTVREIAPGELAGRSFSCDTDLLPPPPAQLPLIAAGPVPGNKAVTASYTARVAYETDREYLDKFDGNTTSATNYIGDLTAHASTIYGTEVDTTWQVASVSLWSSSDPWTQQNRRSCLLFEFSRYWNQRNPMPGTPVRTVAHLLNATDTNGGEAFFDGLCRHGWSLDSSDAGCSLTPAIDDYGGSYGVSGGIRGDFDINDPQSVWDIVVLVHEVGHNFNSPHTHCYGNIGGSPDPIDPCSRADCGYSGCWCGAPSLPLGCPGEGQGCGTIMSYCPELPGGNANVALTLGAPVGGHPYGVMPERVPNLQRVYVAAQAAAYPGCLDFAGTDVTLSVIKAGTGTGTVTSAPAGIVCGADCSEQYPQSTEVTLTAAADAGSTFAGWSGGGCSGTGTCVVTLNSDTTVTANLNAAVGDCPGLTIGCFSSVFGQFADPAATQQIDNYTCPSGSFPYPGKELVYAFTAPGDGAVTVELTGLSADFDLLVLSNGAGCNGDNCMDVSRAGSSSDERVTFTATGGEVYDFSVEDYDGVGGSFTISVTDCPPGPVCAPDPYTACLLGGRFRVEGTMNDFSSPPQEFVNRVMSFPGIRAESDQAVFFQSFNAGNFEVGVKMVDACGLPEGHPLRAYWAFFGGLTNAETWIEIEDTVTGYVYLWFNPAGQFPVTMGDTGAFPCLDGAPAEPCVRNSNTACLIGGRFEVTGTMLDFSDPPREFPVAVMDFPSGRAESEQAVFFESFSPGNFEIGVKMVDGCGFPEGHPLRFFWVFYGGLTNAQAEVRVTQISTGLVDVWSNPAGVFPRAEGRTSAFPCE